MSTSIFKQAFAVATVLLFLLCCSYKSINAQGYLHVDGLSIVDGNGENFIIKSIGTGNWMIQEGYMMQSADVAPTQHEFRQKLEETIGETKTEEFYESWFENHFRKIDVDSMAAWGFNTVRVAMHYKWFTPPIEEESVQGEITWKDKGFNMIDKLLSWCEENKMYLILDLHGAPGGQGANADISDYDDTKPSLWESDLNKDKTVALWGKLAERYGDSSWIGGYDLINEINWTFPEGNNSQIRELYGRITDTIRAVDPNHIIFIEGNSWANDFSGLTPAWDDNMAYSFHKYWNYNDANALKWITDFREEHNRPIWLGETGENSNTWFANLAALSEDNNVGWSWWPVKKSGINNVLKVTTNEDYTKLIEMWKGNGSMTADEAYNAVMTFADNHKFENCNIQRDVIDALIRQPQSTKTLPYKKHTIGENIFAVDYDLGRNNYAYFDVDTANYHLNTNEFKAWNIGWEYRNDGVDIEKCSDSEANNGYNVGWVEKGEWLQYTIQSQAHASYKLELRTASESSANMHIEVNGKRASDVFEVPSTGSWKAFKTTTIENIILPEGEIKIRLVFDSGTLNVNYFTLIETGSVSEVPFELLRSSSATIDNEIYLDFNKPITSQENEISINEFELKVDDTNIDISDLYHMDENDQQIILTTDENLFYNHNITISYNGSTLKSSEQDLEDFSDVSVKNNFYRHYEVPGKIEAESFITNKGFELEDCTDTGAGKNTAYASDGDYLEYLLFVPVGGTFNMNFRVATEKSAEIQVMNSEDGELVNNESISFGSTNGWQSWQTKSINVDLPQGKVILKLVSLSGEHNLNWISFEENTVTGIKDLIENSRLSIYPNPTSDILKVEFDSFSERQLQLFTMSGIQLESMLLNDSSISIKLGNYPVGTYLLRINGDEINETFKVLVVR